MEANPFDLWFRQRREQGEGARKGRGSAATPVIGDTTGYGTAAVNASVGRASRRTGRRLRGRFRGRDPTGDPARSGVLSRRRGGLEGD